MITKLAHPAYTTRVTNLRVFPPLQRGSGAIPSGLAFTSLDAMATRDGGRGGLIDGFHIWHFSGTAADLVVRRPRPQPQPVSRRIAVQLGRRSMCGPLISPTVTSMLCIRFSVVHRSGYGGELRLPFLPTRIFRAGYPKRIPPHQRGEQDVFSGIFGLILKADHDP